MQTSILLVVLIIYLLIFRGVKNGKMTFTVKKFIFGLVVTIVIINAIMFLIM
ncbi:hypothetical protein JOC74_003479 [Bacillus capparidis]|uniref:DUF3976 domain-containing protein n=1 Tax=Bacillus capparidis TaxID=1840411 RepID=A0ABS4D020_9BACI|nr:hypothetical protein [Bacillus capparidis]